MTTSRTLDLLDLARKKTLRNAVLNGLVSQMTSGPSLMSPSPFLHQAWLRWKTLRLPWRKQFLVGLDLHGNTYWEFKDVRGAEGRWRRMVRYPRKTHHDDVQVSPAWHQWLRNTRKEPPSLREQHEDLVRQERMKLLAAEADARWEAKPSMMDAPGEARGQAVPTLGSSSTIREKNPEAPPAPVVDEVQQSVPEQKQRADPQRRAVWRDMQRRQQDGTGTGPGPWKSTRGGPSEEWQPKPWQPTPTRK